MTQPTYNCLTVAIVCSSVTDRSTKEAVFWWIYWSGDCRSCQSVSFAYGSFTVLCMCTIICNLHTTRSTWALQSRVKDNLVRP